MAQETLVVKVVPDDAPIADPSTAHSPDRARYSSDMPVLGKSPTFPRRPLGSAQPDRRRSLRSDSSLGAASDLVWADDDDDDDDDDDEAVWRGRARGHGAEARVEADRGLSFISKQRSSRKRTERGGGGWWTADGKKTRTYIRGRVTRFLDAAAPQTFLFLVLLVALFLTDAVAFLSAPDAVDAPVAWTMLGALVVFSAELALNCACRDGYPWSFYFFMDALGTFSLVADVPFLSEGWLPDGAEIGTTLRVSRAAKFGARASKDGARLVRFVRSVATLRLLRPWTAFLRESRGARRSSRRGQTSTGKIASDLDESMSKSVAVVVLLTILAAPLLLWDDSDTIPAAYHSSLAAVSSDDTAASAEAVADAVAGGFFEFFSASERKPVALAFAGNVWWWTDTYPRSPRSTDRLVLSSGDCGAEASFFEKRFSSRDASASSSNASSEEARAPLALHSSPCVALELDIALVNKWTAMLNIGMVLFVIVELVLVSALLTMVTTKLVVAPLERIFGNIKKNMDALFVTFESSSGETRGETRDGKKSRDGSRVLRADGKERQPADAGDGLDAMEAAIDKMARLVRHVAGSNAQGAHMFREYVDDENVDENTRAWLMDMNAGGEGKTPKKDGQHLKPSRTLTPSKSIGARVFERSLTPPRNTPGGSPMSTRKPSLSSRPSLGTPPRSSPAMSRRGSRALAPVSLSRSFDAAAGIAPAAQSTDSRHKVATRDAADRVEVGTRKTSVDDDASDKNRSLVRGFGRSPSFESARGKEADSLSLEAETSHATTAAFDSRLETFHLDEHLDDDFLDDEGAPMKAGPELQLRQARARSRARAQGAAAAAAAARASGVALPEHLDPRLIDTWAFDVLAMSREEARAYVLMMFGSMGLLRLDEGGPDDVPEAGKASLDADTAASEGFCSPKTLWNFLERLEGGYRRNAYHNFQHAVDVTHTVYRYAVLTEPRTHVTQTEKFALMVAALAHDLDHPGVSNAFLVNTRDPLATVYNDSSVLENAHVAALYNLIRTRQMREGAGSGDERDDAAAPPSAEDEANVFTLLDDDLYREVRATIIAAVLHTDMSHHFKMVSQMEVFHELHSEGIKANTRRVRRGVMVDCIYQKEDDRRFILCVLLHAADIGNPVKPLKTYRKWANRVLSEFFAQGDLEKEKGMPVSAMMDAAATNAAMSQINFMEFVVAPLYANFTRLFPEARELVTHLIENRVHFQRALERELDGEESPDEPGLGSRAGLERVPAAERFFAESGGARAARAGAGKSSAEREADKHATRARFKALVEKHDFKARLMSASFDSFDSERDVTCEGNDFAERAAFEALMREAPRNAKLARLPPSPRADGSPNALSGFGPDATGSRRTLLAAAAAGVRDAALAAGASAKKLRRPSGKADASARSPPRAT